MFALDLATVAKPPCQRSSHKTTMLTKVNINTVTGLFPTKTANMPKMLTPGTRPTYTSIRNL